MVTAEELVRGQIPPLLPDYFAWGSCYGSRRRRYCGGVELGCSVNGGSVDLCWKTSLDKGWERERGGSLVKKY
jgi:hypothetical protein